MGVVHDKRIGPGKIQARFDDRGAHKDVGLAMPEAVHGLFQGGFRHLAVGHGHLGPGSQGLDVGRDVLQALHPVVDPKDLPLAFQFALYDLAQQALVALDKRRFHGLAIHRRGLDDRQAAHPGQRQLQGARDGRGGERQGVDIFLEGLEPFLVLDAKPLFLVENEQADVGDGHVGRQDAVGADQDVHLPPGHGFEHHLAPLGGDKARKHLDAHRKAFQTGGKILIVLFGQHGRRTQHGHLLAVEHGPEGGAKGHFGLAKAHIAADQPVHGFGPLHVGQDFGNGPLLIRRLLKAEGGLEFQVEFVGGTVGIALGHLPVGVHLDQIGGDALDGLLGPFAYGFPTRPAQAIKRRRDAFGAFVALHEPEPVGRQVELVLVGKDQQQIITARGVHGHAGQSLEGGHAVVAMDHQVAGPDFVKGGQSLEILVAAPLSPGFGRFGMENILSQDAGVAPGQFHAVAQRRKQGKKAGLARGVAGAKDQPLGFDHLEKFLTRPLAVKGQDGLALAVPVLEGGHQGGPGAFVRAGLPEDVAEALDRLFRQIRTMAAPAHDQILKQDAPAGHQGFAGHVLRPQHPGRRPGMAAFLGFGLKKPPPGVFGLLQAFLDLGRVAYDIGGVLGKPGGQFHRLLVKKPRPDATVAGFQAGFQVLLGRPVQFAGAGNGLPQGAGLVHEGVRKHCRSRRQQGGLGQFGQGALGPGVKAAHGLDRVAEKFQAQRAVVARRKDVEDVAAKGELARIGDHGGTLVAPQDDLLGNKVPGQFLACGHIEDIALQGAQRRPFGQQVVGRDQQHPRPAAHGGKGQKGHAPGPEGPAWPARGIGRERGIGCSPECAGRGRSQEFEQGGDAGKLVDARGDHHGGLAPGQGLGSQKGQCGRPALVDRSGIGAGQKIGQWGGNAGQDRPRGEIRDGRRHTCDGGRDINLIFAGPTSRSNGTGNTAAQNRLSTAFGTQGRAEPPRRNRACRALRRKAAC
ncbi:hypothetical protein DVDV_3911 [Desulfovibrio sp. DV]|nr:hypothetical protein DVDV_3911 [Desulfovibrio sp. DV]